MLAEWIVLAEDLLELCTTLAIRGKVREQTKDDIFESIDVKLTLLHAK